MQMKDAKRAHRKARKTGVAMPFRAWARQSVRRAEAEGKLLRILMAERP